MNLWNNIKMIEYSSPLRIWGRKEEKHWYRKNRRNKGQKLKLMRVKRVETFLPLCSEDTREYAFHWLTYTDSFPDKFKTAVYFSWTYLLVQLWWLRMVSLLNALSWTLHRLLVEYLPYPHITFPVYHSHSSYFPFLLSLMNKNLYNCQKSRPLRFLDSLSYYGRNKASFSLICLWRS